jgi:hypothetical protein
LQQPFRRLTTPSVVYVQTYSEKVFAQAFFEKVCSLIIQFIQFDSIQFNPELFLEKLL